MGSCSLRSSLDNNTIVTVQNQINKRKTSTKTSGVSLRFDVLDFNTSLTGIHFNYPFIAEGELSLEPEDPFTQKKMVFKGPESENNYSQTRISVACRKGLKDTLNQDNFFIVSKPPFLALGVLDGHGENGHKISSIVSKTLHRILLSNTSLGINPTKAIKQSYIETQNIIVQKCHKKNIDCSYSGCTCTMILIYRSCMYISSLGDSRAVLGKVYMDNLIAIPLTTDQKPEDPVEKARILRSGGVVKQLFPDDCPRVFLSHAYQNGLSVTRAFGDIAYESIGIICEPVVTEQKLEKNDKYLIICSDGVWEFIDNYEAVKTIDRKSATSLSDDLVKLAWDRWIENTQNSADDITVIILPLF
jgi:serine/threonine protein phosphatase PrpC